MHFENKRNI